MTNRACPPARWEDPIKGTMPSFDDPYNHHHHHPQGGAPPPKPNQKFLSLILKAMIMAFVTTLFFFLLGVASIVLLLATAALHRHSTPSNSYSNEFSIKELKKLPQFRYCKRSRADGETTDCVVCLEGIRQGQWCRKLARCGHVFHRRCVDAWFVKAPSCPICRTSVRPQMEAVLEDRSFWGSSWRNELGVS